MISKIRVVDRNINSKYSIDSNKEMAKQSPNFKGGLATLALMGIQECEKNPMVNVAVIDMLSAILPRTFVESRTNWFAGFEAFRRESSGLIVNCLIPSFITWGVAQGMNNFIMPKGSNMAGCWADSSLIEKATELYEKSHSDNKVKDVFKEILRETEGFHGKDKVQFKNVLTEAELEIYAKRLEALSKSDISRKRLTKKIEVLTKKIVEKTHVYENINVAGEKGVKASNVKALLEDTVKYFKQYQNAGNEVTIRQFAEQSKKLVKSKSLMGLAIVLPLAASMQYINRWITEKTSGVKGAPIYEDYGKNQNEEIKKKSKEGLLKQKIISISSMIGVGLLSMMKKPTLNMLEFKGMFPTMDQARIISTTTFASRMAAADDKNELREATVRDIATFSSLYFLGDYGAKAAATIIENKTGITLLNDTKPIDKNANVLKKFWHWVKDVTLKSSEEVVSKTAETLKAQGLKPTEAQAEQITKELKKAVNLRSACQVANLGVSLLLLGAIIPIFTRKSTKKKHAEALKLAQQDSSNTVTVTADENKAKATRPTA